MTDEHAEGSSRVVVYLDDDQEPLFTYTPPVRFELDTSQLEDGPHVLRVEAFGANENKGVRRIPFTVRNGPGIAVEGVSNNDVLEGRIPILVNSYGGAGEPNWEPSRAETPAPIPTWAWVLFIVIATWAMWYLAGQLKAPAEFAKTPTYSAYQASAKPPAEQVGARQAAAKDTALGAAVYSNNCASCHQAGGQGVAGVFPPLAGNPVVTADDPTEHIKVVLEGARGEVIDGVAYAAPMPAWADQLSDAEIAAVVNHERTSWGNQAPTVTAEDVTKLRR